MMLISKMKLTLLSVFALWTATLTTNAKEGKVTCTAPPVARGETGSITCHFPVDITTLRPVAYSVEHYASTESTEDSVLSCNWIDTEKPPCLPKDGYAFDDPNSTGCEPLDCGKGVSVCAKRKDDGPPKARCNCTGTGMTGTQCDVMPVGSTQENDNKLLVIGVVAGIIVLIIVVVLAVYCYRKRRGTSTDERNMSGRSEAGNLLNSGQPGDGDNVHNDTVPVTNDQEAQNAELSAAQENQDRDFNKDAETSVDKTARNIVSEDDKKSALTTHGSEEGNDDGCEPQDSPSHRHLETEKNTSQQETFGISPAEAGTMTSADERDQENSPAPAGLGEQDSRANDDDGEEPGKQPVEVSDEQSQTARGGEGSNEKITPVEDNEGGVDTSQLPPFKERQAKFE
ncbi:uncharacterized protein [Littorina saxatilis]|uniref:uncharacterized protein n=1 Tax=Littorina saxatilis TaxID=31220 RepID=UPI0038B48D0E